MRTLANMLIDFWTWAGVSAQEYAELEDPDYTVEPFYYPNFTALRRECMQQINNRLTPQQLDDFLTCLALDAEEEEILDMCKNFANDEFLNILIPAGCQHLQPQARWQIAELLLCRSISKSDTYIALLCADTHPYVRKRAEKAKEFKGQGDGSVVPSESE